MKVAVIGSGLSGLACASRLLDRKCEVHVFDKERDVGGLAGYTTLNGYRFPKTYHHVLRSDRFLNDAFHRFQLSVDWRRVKVGFYADSEIFPFNNAFDLMKFRPLSLSDRFRLGWLVLTSKYEKRLRDVSVKEWVTSKVGGGVYENFVSPLISTYFGSSEDIAAAYLARRWSDESKYASNSIGYANFPKLIDCYVDEIRCKNGLLKTNYKIKAITVGKSEVSLLSRNEDHYDAAVLTCPTNESRLLLRGVHRDVIDQLNAIEYRACLCLALRLEVRVSDYYWVNVLDREIPFIACFEHGNLNPGLEGGLVYMVKYLSQNNPLWSADAGTIRKVFTDGLRKIFKSLPKITGWTLFRTRYGTPVYRSGYRNVMTNPYPRIYFAGVYSAFPEIRSSGPAIRTGIETAEKVSEDQTK